MALAHALQASLRLDDDAEENAAEEIFGRRGHGYLRALRGGLLRTRDQLAKSREPRRIAWMQDLPIAVAYLRRRTLQGVPCPVDPLVDPVELVDAGESGLRELGPPLLVQRIDAPIISHPFRNGLLEQRRDIELAQARHRRVARGDQVGRQLLLRLLGHANPVRQRDRPRGQQAWHDDFPGFRSGNIQPAVVRIPAFEEFLQQAPLVDLARSLRIEPLEEPGQGRGLKPLDEVIGGLDVQFRHR